MFSGGAAARWAATRGGGRLARYAALAVQLLQTASVVVLCIVAFSLLLGRLQARRAWLRPDATASGILYGVAFGALGVVALEIPIAISAGVQIGLTPALVVGATLFGGIGSGFIVAAIVQGARALAGDPLAIVALPPLLAVWICAAAVRLRRRRRHEAPKLRDVASLGVASGLLVVGAALTGPDTLVPRAVVVAFAPYWFVVTVLSTVAVGGVLIYLDRARMLQGALEDSRAMLERVLELGHIGYSHTDPRTGRARLSESLRALRRLPRRDSVSLEQAIAMICEPDRARYRAARQAAIEQRREFEDDFRVRRGDGTIGWERIVGRPIFDEAGTLVDFITVCQDITGRKAADQALRESEERYELLVDGSREGMYDRDIAGGTIWFSERAHQILGLPNGALNGARTKYLAYIHPDDLAEYERQTARQAGSGYPRIWRRFRMRHADGSIRWIESHARMVYDAAGTPVRTVGSFGDVTDRVVAETELKASEEKFAAAFLDSVMPLAIVGAKDGVYLEVNEAAARLVGRTRAEMIGRTVRELNIWADIAERDRVSAIVAAEGSIREYRMQVCTSTGEIRDCVLSASLVEVGGKPCIISSVRDITEQLEAERRLAEVNAERDAHLRRLRDITDNLPVLIALLDRDGHILFINRTGERWYARPAAAVLGRTRRELLGADTTELDRDVIPRVLAGETLQVERTIPYPDGITRDVEVTYVPDLDAAGGARGYYALINDITERKAKDLQLRQSQRMEAVGQLTGGVAHDFNNLLSMISGSLELMADSFGPADDRRTLVETALRATQRGATLTRSLMAFSRLQPLEPRPVDPTALLGEMMDLLRRTVPENIDMGFVPEAGTWACEVDPGQLQNAILNLVANARDAMPSGGRLSIGCGNAAVSDADAARQTDVASGSYVVLTIADSGRGMSEETLARAFEPFFTTKEVGQGTGLGLSMVYGFVKQSQGHVRIDSGPGRGTTVQLYLPRAAQPADQAAVVPPAPAAGAAGDATILVVEDEADLRFIAQRMLRSSGYQVVVAADAREGMERLDETPGVSLILTDVVLTGDSDGFQFATKARARLPGVKVLYMSGHAEGAFRQDGRLAPGVQILQKPFTREELADKIRLLLDHGAA